MIEPEPTVQNLDNIDDAIIEEEPAGRLVSFVSCVALDADHQTVIDHDVPSLVVQSRWGRPHSEFAE